jgi:predicted nucleotidyltransferase
MRETLGRHISLRWVKEVLSCSELIASRVLVDLERDGFITTINGHFEPSLKGSALAQATAARPLIRATAEHLVSEVVKRAKLINADDDWAYRVSKLVLFGSLLRGAERPNDVDIACRLEPRWRGEAQRLAEELRRAACDRPFRNICQDVA